MINPEARQVAPFTLIAWSAPFRGKIYTAEGCTEFEIKVTDDLLFPRVENEELQ